MLQEDVDVCENNVSTVHIRHYTYDVGRESDDDVRHTNNTQFAEYESLV